MGAKAASSDAPTRNAVIRPAIDMEFSPIRFLCRWVQLAIFLTYRRAPAYGPDIDFERKTRIFPAYVTAGAVANRIRNHGQAVHRTD
jgi:hypothetical protein